jgi:hypothetical protein
MTDDTGSATCSGTTADEHPLKLKSLIGTGQARFLNQYNPLHDKPFERPTLNTGIYVDPDLAKLLEQERNACKEHHKKKDIMKTYHDECVKYAAVTKGGKK